MRGDVPLVIGSLEHGIDRCAAPLGRRHGDVVGDLFEPPAVEGHETERAAEMQYLAHPGLVQESGKGAIRLEEPMTSEM